MRGFTISVFFLIIDVSWVCCVQTEKGRVGGKVEINCNSELESEILSVELQKMGVSKNVTIIESAKEGETLTRGRYSLYYESSTRPITATAIIYNLSREDTGTYWCLLAGYQDYDDHYTEPVNLEVESPPTSKPPMTTGNTSAQGSTTDLPPGKHLALIGGLGAALLVGLLVLILILLKKKRAQKRAESPQSSQRNLKECNNIYAEIEEPNSSTDQLQTPQAPANQNQEQDTSPVMSIYATANHSQEELPASSQATNQISDVTTETDDPNCHSVVANPIEPMMPTANDIIYSLAIDPVQPTDMTDTLDSPSSDT